MMTEHFLWKADTGSSDILVFMMIKAIILDLGGVLLRTTDFTPRERLAEQLGMSRHGLEDFIFGGESGSQAQRGDIPVQQHWDNLAAQLHLSRVQFRQVLEQFFGNDELDQNLLEYVRNLHVSYKTGLLSNAFGDLRQIIHERWHFEDAFDDMVISAEVGLVKPDQAIFRLAVEQLGVKAEEAVFIDDMPHNTDGAKRAGLFGIRFLNPQQLKLDLDLLLNGHRG
jgi:epoxide hydrolase-like predicted phosphatase